MVTGDSVFSFFFSLFIYCLIPFPSCVFSETKRKEFQDEEEAKLTTLEQRYKNELASSEAKLKALQQEIEHESKATELLLAAKKELVVAKADLELSLKEVQEKFQSTKLELEEVRTSMVAQKEVNQKLTETSSALKEEKSALSKEISELKGAQNSSKALEQEVPFSFWPFSFDFTLVNDTFSHGFHL